MIIKGVNLAQLKEAFDACTWHVAGGIKWRYKPKELKKDVWQVALGTKIKGKNGSGLPIKPEVGTLHDVLYGKRISAVCWHVYYWFFRYLPSLAEVKVKGRPAFLTRRGDGWKNYESGLPYAPIRMRDRCTCAEGGRGLSFTPIIERLRRYPEFDESVFDGLDMKGKRQCAAEVMRIGQLKIQFGRCASDLHEWFAELGEFSTHLVELHVSKLETWDTDVLNRFTESRQGYDQIGG